MTLAEELKQLAEKLTESMVNCERCVCQKPAEPAPLAAPLTRAVSDTLVRRMQTDAAYCREILAELARLEAENAQLRTATENKGSDPKRVTREGRVDSTK